jgi:hypothetical protein
MKALLTLLATTVLFSSPAHAVSGQILSSCTGSDETGTEISTRLQITPIYGLTLFVVRGENLEVMEAAAEDKLDPRGISYNGNSGSLLIPNIQQPNASQPGKYAAILTLKGKASVILSCK